MTLKRNEKNTLKGAITQRQLHRPKSQDVGGEVGNWKSKSHEIVSPELAH